MILTGNTIDEIRSLPNDNDFKIRLKVYEYQAKQNHIDKDVLLDKASDLVLDYLKFKRQQTIAEINRTQKVTVIDSVMGSGKTSWAIDYMNTAIDENILYITPFKTEIARVQQAVTMKDMKTPKVLGKNHYKMDDLKDLLGLHEDIASTHKLFSSLETETAELIRQGEYILILDETLGAVEPYEGVKKADIDYLLKNKSIIIDKDNYINWIDRDFENEDFKYSEIRNLALNHSLFYVNDKILMWNYPSEIFQAFKKIYIMTYMFDASIMYYYFKLNNITFQKKSICKENNQYKLRAYYESNISDLKKYIQIYKTDIIQKKDTALSSNWFKKADSKTKSKLKKSIYNWVRNVVNAKSNDVMWTTFLDYKYSLQGKGYTNGFVEWNCKSTNEYSDRKYLVYALNVYPHVGITQFFAKYGIIVNQDLFALSEMIQWIWRSAIRNGEHIDILIISNRMRFLLEQWLNGSLKYKPNASKVLKS